VRIKSRPSRACPDPWLSLVIPAYNEVDRIENAIIGVRAALEPGRGAVEIIVVDDGSVDGTGREAETAGADRVIRLALNQGKGAAVRAGVAEARGRVVAFTDADLAYPPAVLIELVALIERGNEVAVGSRHHVTIGNLIRLGRLREVGGRAVSLLGCALLLGRNRDTQCGLKAFRSDVAKALFGASVIDGFAFDLELFHLAELRALSIAELPVEAGASERSSVRVFSDGAQLLRDLVRIRLRALRGS